MELQAETVWVVVDGVGQPCLAYIMHRKPVGSDERDRPDLPDELDPEYGPYRVVPYRLHPDRERGA